MKKLILTLCLISSLNFTFASTPGGYFGKKWTVGANYAFSSGMMLKSFFNSTSYSSITNFGIFAERTINRKHSIVIGLQNFYSPFGFNWSDNRSWTGSIEQYYSFNNVVRSTKFIGYKFSFLNGGNVNPIGWYYMLGLSQTKIKAEILSNELPLIFKNGYDSGIKWLSLINEIGKVIPITKSVSMTIAVDFTIKAPKYLLALENGYLNTTQDDVKNSINMNIILHNAFKYENTLILKGGLNYHF